MRIFVTAKPRAMEERVEKTDETHFIVSVTEPPVAGAANRAIVRALASFFDISASAVQLRSGFSSKQKVFEIN